MKCSGRESSKIIWNTKGSHCVGKKAHGGLQLHHGGLWPTHGGPWPTHGLQPTHGTEMRQGRVRWVLRKGSAAEDGGHGTAPQGSRHSPELLECWDTALRPWVCILGAGWGQGMDLIPSNSGCSMIL